jgi:hypothetical protein
MPTYPQTFDRAQAVAHYEAQLAYTGFSDPMRTFYLTRLSYLRPPLPTVPRGAPLPPSSTFAASHPLLDLPLSFEGGLLVDTLASPVSALTFVAYSLDILLLLAELFGVLAALALIAALLPPLRPGALHADCLAFAQLVGLSLTELSVVLTGLLGFVALDLLAASTEDETADLIAVALLCLIAGTALGLLVATLLQTIAIFAHLGGAALTRALLVDLLNFGLGLLRVAFCFVRYLFYDLQSEVMDLAFHGADLEG